MTDIPRPTRRSRRTAGQPAADYADPHPPLDLSADADPEQVHALAARQYASDCRWIAPYQDLPRLCHVGHLDAQRTQPQFSLEGGEVSVSPAPDAWRQIADCSGPTYEFIPEPSRRSYRSRGRFYTIDPSTDLQSFELDYCRKHGFISMTDGYVVRWTDAETGNQMSTKFSDADTAFREADARGSSVSVEQAAVAVLDDRGTAYWRSAFGRPPAEARPLEVETLVTIWTAAALDVDGCYWPHPTDVAAHSAPRGLVFQHQLDRWRVTEVNNP